MRCLTNFLRRLSGSQPRPSPEKAFRNCCCRTLHLLHRGNGGPGAFTKFKEKREWGPEPRTLFLHPQHSALPCTALFCEGRNGPLSQLDRLSSGSTVAQGRRNVGGGIVILRTSSAEGTEEGRGRRQSSFSLASAAVRRGEAGCS